MERRALKTRTTALAEKRQVRVICSTERRGRDDIVLVASGIHLEAYRTNPIVLWQHNPDWPIARAIDIRVIGTDLVALVQFPKQDASGRADEIYNLICEGVVNAASTGFEALDVEPLDPSNRGGGSRITQCELQEFSFVSIPAVPDALVTERAHRGGRKSIAPRHRRLAALFAEELRAARKPLPKKHRSAALKFQAELRAAPGKSPKRQVAYPAEPGPSTYNGGRPAYAGDRSAWLEGMYAFQTSGR